MREEYDAIVVGGGGSGLACAMTAAERGADVLLLEKQPKLGGATGIAVGSFTACGSALQQKAGYDDNPNDHEEDAGARMVNMEITYGPELRFVAPPRDGFQQLLPSKGVGMKAMGLLLPLVPRPVIHWMIKRLLVTWQHPENAILDDGAILLNRSGHRFCDETISPDREIAVASQPEKVAYLLLDARLIDRYSAWPHFISTAPEIAYAYVADYLRLRPDVAVQGRSLHEVATARGLPPAEVNKAVAQFNSCVERDGGDTFGRRCEHPLTDGNCWVLLSPVKSYFTTTEGGAAIDQQMRVLDEHDHPIPGLYAVGQNGLPTMTGFLLRSKVVAAWPDLQVDAYSKFTSSAASSPGDLLSPIRPLQKLSSDILCGLIGGVIRTLDLHQAPTVLHFGIERDDQRQFTKRRRDDDGHLTEDSVPLDDVWRGNAPSQAGSPRVLDFAELALQTGADSGATFAMRLLTGVDKVRFSINRQEV